MKNTKKKEGNDNVNLTKIMKNYEKYKWNLTMKIQKTKFDKII